MRPALDRLLSRPFSLKLLRYLTSPFPKTASTVTKNSRTAHNHHQSRHVTQAAAFGSSADGDSSLSESPTNEVKSNLPVEQSQSSKPDSNATSKHANTYQIALTRKDLARMTFSELEFESNLGDPRDSSGQRLVHQKASRNNLELWAVLLEHRRRIQGIDGIRVIWDHIQPYLKLHGDDKDLIWNSFIDLGLRDRKVLGQIVSYANKHVSTPLPTLYVRIVQHFAMQGNRGEVKLWHRLLISRHPPCAARFRQMIRFIVNGKGDLDILQYICEGNDHLGLYSKVVPVLAAQVRFNEALRWHYLLISRQDLPSDLKATKVLQTYLECYFPAKAAKFQQSLIDAGVASASASPDRVHWEPQGKKENQYNDSLGARWFATTWVSIDLAINSIHALGMREIGPLSLQAIALREPTASQIVQRITQLKTLEISIGTSKYAQAVDLFSKREMHTLLKSLLESDQHPDAMEDWRLQESLLGRYAAVGDWIQYVRTSIICLFGGTQPKIEEFNVLLRDLLSRPDMNMENITNVMDEMRARGLPVQPMTSGYLLQKLLRPRQKGHRPIHLAQNPTDIEIAISMFQNLLKSGSWIPEYLWIEIMKRLGMGGNFADLEALCLFLVEWYHPRSTTRRREVLSQCRQSPDMKRFEIPAALNKRHPKHPFSLLFSAGLQAAVVEWGFTINFRKLPNIPYHGDHGDHGVLPAHESANFPIGKHPVTQGIRLLHILESKGVYISASAVRAAIKNRLIAYYGTGFSNRWHNRLAKKRNPFIFDEMVREIQAAWAIKCPRHPLFKKDDRPFLRAWIHRMSVARTQIVRRKRARFSQRMVAKKNQSLSGGGYDQIF